MSSDIELNSKPDSSQQSGKKMNSTRPNPSKTSPGMAAMSEPYDRVQRADEK